MGYWDFSEWKTVLKALLNGEGPPDNLVWYYTFEEVVFKVLMLTLGAFLGALIFEV